MRLLTVCTLQYIQVAAYFWRIVVAVTFSRRLIADASIVRNVLFATFLVFLSVRTLSFHMQSMRF